MIRNQKRGGFTLIELMVVIMIMMVLSGIVLGIANYASRKAAEGRARAELQQLRNALDEYRLAVGQYPSVTIVGDSGSAAPWIGIVPHLTNYVENLSFVDPWGRVYQYRPQGRFSFDLWSRGMDPSDAVIEDDIR